MLTTDNYGDHIPTKRTLHRRDKRQGEEEDLYVRIETKTELKT